MARKGATRLELFIDGFSGAFEVIYVTLSCIIEGYRQIGFPVPDWRGNPLETGGTVLLVQV